MQVSFIQSELDGLYFSREQKIFHRAFLSSSLHLMYTDKERKRVVSTFDLHDTNKIGVIVSGPTFKTYAILAYCVVFALALPSTTITIHSPGMFLTEKRMHALLDIIRKLHHEKEIIHQDKERVIVRSFENKTSTIQFFPHVLGSGVRMRVIIERSNATSVILSKYDANTYDFGYL